MSINKANVKRIPQHNTSRTFLAIVVVLFVVHLLAGLWFDKFEISADGAEYLRFAEHMLNGRGFSFDGENPVVGKTPGTSVLIAAYLMVNESLWGLHAIQLSILFLGYLAVMVFTRRSLGSGPALAVLLALVSLQPIRGLASNALSEPLFIAGFAWGVALAHKALSENKLRMAWLAGISFGIATYARPVSFFWPVVLVVLVYLLHRDRVRTVLYVLFAHMIVVTPWIVRGYSEFGKVIPMASNWGPMLTMTDEELWLKFSKTGTKDVYETPHFVQAAKQGFLFNFAPQEILRSATLEGWKRDVSGTLRRCVRQSAFAWTYIPGTKEWTWKHPLAFRVGRAAMVLFLLVSAVGLVALWRSDRLSALLIGGQVVYTAAVMFPVASESRYLVPSYICLIPATTVGFGYMLNIYRAKKAQIIVRSSLE